MTQIDPGLAWMAAAQGIGLGQHQLALSQDYELAQGRQGLAQQELGLRSDEMELRRRQLIAQQLREASAQRFNTGEYMRLHPPEYQQFGPPGPDGQMQQGPIDPEWQLGYEQFSQAPSDVQEGYLGDERKAQNQQRIEEARRNAQHQAMMRGLLSIDEAERSGLITPESAEQARASIMFRDAGVPSPMIDNLTGTAGAGMIDPNEVYNAFYGLSGDPMLSGAASLQAQMTGKPPTSGMFTQIPRTTPPSVQGAKIDVEALEAQAKATRAQATAADAKGDYKGALALEDQAAALDAQAGQARAALAKARKNELTRRMKLQDNGAFPGGTGTEQTHQVEPRLDQLQGPPAPDAMAPTIDPTKIKATIGQKPGMLSVVDATGAARDVMAPKTAIDAVSAACALLGLPTDRQLSEEEAQAVASVAQKLRDAGAMSDLRDAFQPGARP